MHIEGAGASFGWSLDANEDYVAVGAVGEDIDGSNKVGTVYPRIDGICEITYY